MKRQEGSKLTREVKIKKTSHVILTSSETRGNDLNKAVSILKNGGVVIFPTDTVYGIGCRFDDQKAVDRIYQIKGTPKTQPFPILVSSISQVGKLTIINDVAKKLMQKYWPGALTIILFSRHSGSGFAGDKISKIGFRIPDSRLVQSLIDQTGVPIIGTSANFHGQKAPSSFKGLDPNFLKLADFVIEGECQSGAESTVVDTTVNPPKILRQGALKLTD